MSAFDNLDSEVDAAQASDAAQSPAPAESTTEAAVEAPEATSAEQTNPTAEPSGEGAQGAVEAEGSEGTDDDTTDAETQADIKARQEKYGESWAIRSYRELMDEKRRNKQALELAPLVTAHGPAIVRTGTELAAALLDPSKDAKAIDGLVQKLSEPRRLQLRDHYYTSTVLQFPDETIKGLLGDETADVERVKKGLELLKADEEWRAGGSQLADDEVDPDDLSNLPPALRKEIEDARALREKFPELEREVKGFRTEQEAAKARERETQVNALGDELYDKVWSVVEERKQKLGLDIKPTDTPRIAGLKRALTQHFSHESLGDVFLKDNTNKENYVRAFNHVKGLQRDAAYHFEDVLKLGAERTFQQVLQSPEVSDLLAALKSEMLSQSTPKDPTARDEIVAGAPAAFSPTNAFEDAAKQGITNPFDVSELMAGQGAGR